MKGCGTYEFWLRNKNEVYEEQPPKFDNAEWKAIATKIRNIGINTRKFAEMCNIHPSRWCDIREGRKEATKEEANVIRSVING